jgi:hypothetical protein
LNVGHIVFLKLIESSEAPTLTIRAGWQTIKQKVQAGEQARPTLERVILDNIILAQANNHCASKRRCTKDKVLAM